MIELIVAVVVMRMKPALLVKEKSLNFLSTSLSPVAILVSEY